MKIMELIHPWQRPEYVGSYVKTATKPCSESNIGDDELMARVMCAKWAAWTNHKIMVARSGWPRKLREVVS